MTHLAVESPERLTLAQLPTPLYPLDRLSKELGGPTIWVKRDDLTGSVTSGNKIRKLEYTLAHALLQGCDTIITCGGVESNHCRATAALCAQLGLECHLILRGDEPNLHAGNNLLDRLFGANIHYYPIKTYVNNFNNILEETKLTICNKKRKPLFIPTGASDGYGIWGYIDGLGEIKRQCEDIGLQASAIVHATGSGGTQAGLTLGTVLHDWPVPVYGINVCDDEAYFMNKVRSDVAHWAEVHHVDFDFNQLPINVIDGYVGEGYGKASEAVFSLIRQVAQTEGLVLDPVYTGKAFYGLVEEIKKGRFSEGQDVIFLHTGGNYGLFPYINQLGLS